jgi:hypothetical protein
MCYRNSGSDLLSRLDPRDEKEGTEIEYQGNKKFSNTSFKNKGGGEEKIKDVKGRRLL